MSEASTPLMADRWTDALVLTRSWKVAKAVNAFEPKERATLNQSAMNDSLILINTYSIVPAH